MKKVSWIVVITGAAVGLAAIVLTMLGNPANMGFCIACFLRDIAGACGLHRDVYKRQRHALEYAMPISAAAARRE